MDVYFGSSLIVPGVLCQNQNRIIRSIYLGYSGDFEFYDTQPDPFYGPMDPVYTGLGSRFVLLYDTNSFGLAGQY
jgi:hypothetical protein